MRQLSIAVTAVLLAGIFDTDPAAAQCSGSATATHLLGTGIAACEGAWSGPIDPGGDTLCDAANGWSLCPWDNPRVGGLDLAAALGVSGCYAYNASQDDGRCGPCRGTSGEDDLAGIGAGCWDWTTFLGAEGGCLASAGHRIDASCCADYVDPQTACSQTPLRGGCCGSPSPLPVNIDGVVCCLSGCAGDYDGDGFEGCDDCNDANANVYPGATEVKDGLDNQCVGETGFGSVDEISGVAGFPDPLDPDRFCWPPQQGASEYDVVRSSLPASSADCERALTLDVCWSDVGLPPPAGVFYYLVRSLHPVPPGSFGADSARAERPGFCVPEFICDDGADNDFDGATDCDDVADCYRVDGCEVAAFDFVDGPLDDVASTALADFFADVDGSPSDYIWFQLWSPTFPHFAWCAERADFYRDQYLALAATGGIVSSGSWDRWYRADLGPWEGPDASGYPNWFGSECAGPYSWCAEVDLAGHTPGVAPAESGSCEAFDGILCGGGSWVLEIRIATSRLAACGF